MSVWVLMAYEVKVADGELTLHVAGEDELATLVRILARSGLIPFSVESQIQSESRKDSA